MPESTGEFEPGKNGVKWFAQNIRGLPVWGWAVIVAIGLFVGYRIYRKRKDTVSIPTGSDTGIGGMYSGGVGSGASYQGVSGNITPTEESKYDSNSAWGRAAIAFLVGEGYPPLTASAAIWKYLNEELLNAEEAKLVNLAIAELGPPPYLVEIKMEGLVDRPNGPGGGGTGIPLPGGGGSNLPASYTLGDWTGFKPTPSNLNVSMVLQKSGSEMTWEEYYLVLNHFLPEYISIHGAAPTPPTYHDSHFNAYTNEQGQTYYEYKEEHFGENTISDGGYSWEEDAGIVDLLKNGPRNVAEWNKIMTDWAGEYYSIHGHYPYYPGTSKVVTPSEYASGVHAPTY